MTNKVCYIFNIPQLGDVAIYSYPLYEEKE